MPAIDKTGVSVRPLHSHRKRTCERTLNQLPLEILLPVMRQGPWLRLLLRLCVNQHAARVLHCLFDPLEESDSLPAVNQAVVVRERDVHHGAGLNLAIGQHDSPLCDGVHAQDRGLGGVDDGGAHHGAVHAAVADGEGAARHVVNGDGAVTRLLAHVRQALLDACKVELVHIAQHRHHQALGGGDCNGDVLVVPVHDLVPVNDCVDGRHLRQRVRRRLDEGRHEAQLDAVLLQEHILVRIAHLHQ
mmetsp:Transcript_15405/g.33389  ORF Transcript_15405/g.33389 Transcript_15405/m.33389 type:complete len:245 (-) Transcript_15405:879-1613(-)